MKVVCLYGSPRREGNSSLISRSILEIAREYGWEVAEFMLHELEYCGCMACNACKGEADGCAIGDGLMPVLSSIYDAQVLVIASPVYFGGLNSRVMAFIERSGSYFKVDWVESEDDCRLAPGKKLIFVQTQSEHESLGKFAFAEHFEMLGFKEWSFICASEAGNYGSPDGKEELLKQAREAACKVFDCKGGERP